MTAHTAADLLKPLTDLADETYVPIGALRHALAEVAANVDTALNQARGEAWGEGWLAAQEVVDFEGIKVWAHTVFPEGYAGNPYDRAARGGGRKEPCSEHEGFVATCPLCNLQDPD